MDRIWQSGDTSVSGWPFWHRQAAFDAVNGHSQGDEPPLSFVMEFNAAESEWREAQARLKKMLENLKNGLRR
jgi:hypothetical protein